MNSNIPHRNSSSQHNMPWFTNALKRMCKKKQRLYNKAKKSKSGKYWQQYKSLKKDTLKAIRKRRWQYINDILQVGLEQGDSKPFWKYVRSKRQDSTGVSPLLKNGVLHTENQSKAEILNDQFVSVFTHEDTSDVPHLHGPTYPSISDLHVSTKGVEKLLGNIKPSKAAGPDQIPCRFLKELASELAPILAAIFQQSLRP